MRRGEGSLHGGGTAGRAARWSAAVVLAGALVAGGAASAWAADPPADQGEDAGQAPAPTTTGPTVTGPAPLTGFQANGGFGEAATFVPVPADPAVVPEPPTNDTLPQQVDIKGPFGQQVSCDPVDRPGVTAFALLLSTHYNRPSFSGARPCIDYASFHHDGRALDWPLNAWDAADRQIADAAIAWLTADDGEVAKRFGVEYLIWNGLIWDNNTGRWSYYTGSPHTDHIHFSFTWDGAQMRTSWWTGVAVTQPDLGPCDVTPWQYAALHQVPRLTACDTSALAPVPSTGLARVRPGESGPGVAMLQEVLGIEPSGVLDQPTRDALVAWQQERGIPATGVADEFTYAVAMGWELDLLPADALAVDRQAWQTTAFTPYLRSTLTEGDSGAAVKVLQEALGAEVDGSFGPLTAQALTTWEQTLPVLQAQASRRGDGPATVTPLTWVFLERATHPTIAIRDVHLEHGDLDMLADPDGELAQRAAVDGSGASPYSGGAVARLQQLLGLEDDGSFGPATEAAVMEVQEAAQLEPTGQVDGPTWAAVEAVALKEGRVQGAPGAAATAARQKAEAEKEEAAEKAAAQKKSAEEKNAREQAEREARDARRAGESSAQGGS